MLKEDHDCDMVLTEYQMPGMNILEFAGKARELYTNLQKPLPLIAPCSADYSSSLTNKCAEAGIEGKIY